MKVILELYSAGCATEPEHWAQTELVYRRNDGCVGYILYFFFSDVYACLRVHVWRGQRLTLGVFLSCSLP